MSREQTLVSLLATQEVRHKMVADSYFENFSFLALKQHEMAKWWLTFQPQKCIGGKGIREKSCLQRNVRPGTHSLRAQTLVSSEVSFSVNISNFGGMCAQ